MKLSLPPLILHYSLALTLPLSSLSTPTPIPQQNYPLSLISEFPTPQTFENIAVQSTGNLLLTSTTSPTLFQVSPFSNNNNNNKSTPIAQIPETQGLLGIVELEENIFYIASSNITTNGSVPGSNNIWRVDLRSVTDNSVERGEVSLIANIPTAGTLNGMSRLSPYDSKTLLIADSINGQILTLNVKTGSYSVFINDPILHNTPSGLQVAVDGIHVHDEWLFFTNLNQGIFGRFPLSLTNDSVVGPAEVIVSNTPGDDFVVSGGGNRAWIAMNGHGMVVEVDILKRESRVVVQSGYLEAAAAVAVGRTRFDESSLYVASGGIVGNGSVEEGIVARIDLPYQM
ncbi:hypothetical protein BO78DRAFT_453409 [Aspergillus sclerotiicarbonarius CBS 121057]|uniref:SMP-30/Gluconolactonase/LRE-like region domain-containing protein n=1 Tax=Aspergillus sclerotiicarbonarius (strain CBS 121057 / IBT 28362) TaxID=1448318 RepID=A0A319DY03_ASPSB|nr:hypothetical protein BO78DRAFT_453409 [Aspergillus sclerotiicarbonarius CBS 121057]